MKKKYMVYLNNVRTLTTSNVQIWIRERVVWKRLNTVSSFDLREVLHHETRRSIFYSKKPYAYVRLWTTEHKALERCRIFSLPLYIICSKLRSHAESDKFRGFRRMRIFIYLPHAARLRFAAVLACVHVRVNLLQEFYLLAFLQLLFSTSVFSC